MKLSKKECDLAYGLNAALKTAHGKYVNKVKNEDDEFGENFEFVGIMAFACNFLLTGVTKSGWEKDAVDVFCDELKNAFSEGFEEAIEVRNSFKNPDKALDKLSELLEELKNKLKDCS